MATHDVLTINPEGTAVGILCTPHEETEGLEVAISDWSYWEAISYTNTFAQTSDNYRNYNKLQIGDNETLLDTRVCTPVTYGMVTPHLAYKQYVFTNADTANSSFVYNDTNPPAVKTGGKVYVYAYYTRIALSNGKPISTYSAIKPECQYNIASSGNYVTIKGGLYAGYTGTWELVAGIVYEVD